MTMEYKRLQYNLDILEKHNEIHTPVFHLTDGKTYEQDLVRELITDCRELLSKIENGTLIELENRKPLMWGKDGDTIHCLHCGEDLMGIFDGETEVVQCPKCGGFVYGCIAEDYNEAKLKDLQNGRSD